MAKTFDEINEKIKKGTVVVVTAEEIIDLVEEKGIKEAAKEVDVVTTGAFSPMCSSGAFSNFGHSDPPMKFSREIIVENGGDIFIKSDKDRIIGLYAGDSPLSNKIGLKVMAVDTPMGVCTSSGKIGHSLSFGNAHAAAILSMDTLLADAVATATGNRIKKTNDIERAISFARSIDGVEGVVVIIEDKIGAWGNVNLVRL